MNDLARRDGVDGTVVKTAVAIRIDVGVLLHGVPATMALPLFAETFDPSMRAEDAIAHLLEQAAAHLRQFGHFVERATAADIGQTR